MPPTQLIDQRTIFIICLFGAVSVLAYAIFGLLVSGNASRLHKRLRGGDRRGEGGEDAATVASKKRRCRRWSIVSCAAPPGR